MKPRHWAAFLGLGLIWGSSFLWIKIGLREIGPFTLVAFRLLFGAAGLFTVLRLRPQPFPERGRIWWTLALLGLTNTALPFVLITWGEQTVDSSVAAVLNSSVPLFTLVIAHLALDDEQITLTRAVGLLTGFLGVLLLFSRGLAQSDGGGFLGEIAILIAAISYAGSSVFARRNLRAVPLLVQAFLPLLFADALSWTSAALLEPPLAIPASPTTWMALLWLGLLGSCIAYLLYFYLLHAIGATRTTLVTYVFPVVGVALGVLVLGEMLDWRLLAGASLVVASIAVVTHAPTH